MILPISNAKIPTHITRGNRTEQQYRAFYRWFTENQIDYLTMDPFECFPAGRKQCTFRVLYYAAGELNAIKISPTGRIAKIY